MADCTYMLTTTRIHAIVLLNNLCLIKTKDVNGIDQGLSYNISIVQLYQFASTTFLICFLANLCMPFYVF